MSADAVIQKGLRAKSCEARWGRTALARVDAAPLWIVAIPVLVERGVGSFPARSISRCRAGKLRPLGKDFF